MEMKKWSLTLVLEPRKVSRVLERLKGSRALDRVHLRCPEAEVDELVATDAVQHVRAALPTTSVAVNAPSMEVAIRSGADIWHVKESMLQDPSFKSSAAYFQREQGLVGCSVHSVHSAQLATSLHLDYMHVGTIFPTASHPDKSIEQLEGVQLLRDIRHHLQQTKSPSLIAIGGIQTSSHVSQVLEAGAEGIAVIRAISSSPDPLESAHTFRHLLDQEHEYNRRSS